MINKKYVANIRNLCGATRLTYNEGKAKGMEVIIINNGILNLYVLPDRALDIFRLELKGENIAYISKNGAVNPHCLGREGFDFFKTFQGGFLVTCGLDNVMGKDDHNGKIVPQHGTLTYLPAIDIETKTYEKDNSIFVEVSGTMEDTSLFGSHLLLKRTITLEYGKSSFDLKDEIINEGFMDDEYMIMYHHNFGYPLFNEHSTLWVDSNHIAKGKLNSNLKTYKVFHAPIDNKEEEVFLHTINKGSATHVSLEGNNHKIAISWDTELLPYMNQWKYESSKDYACGLEPAMSPYPKKEYRTIKPNEKHTYILHYEFE